MNRIIILSISALFLIICPLTVQSADKNPKVSDASIDLAVPDSPAFTVLGLNPNSVDRPSSPREFATSLLNGVDANGNLQTGIALEGAPYMLFYGKDTTLRDYQNSKNIRFLSRTMISVATAKGDADVDKSVKLAVGLRFTPWDDGDPRMDNGLLQCLTDAVGKVELSHQLEIEDLFDKRNKLQLESMKEKDEKRKQTLDALVKDLQSQIDKLTEERTDELNKKAAPAIKECRNNKKFRSNLWNKSSWSIDIAPTYTSTTGLREDLRYSGVGIWTSVAFRLGSSGQLILSSRYRNKEEVPDPDNKGQFFEQDSIRGGGRLRFGMPDINFNAEAMYIEERKVSVGTKERVTQYSIGTEHKVSDNLWLVMNVGSESGRAKSDSLFVLGNLKWAFSPEPTIKF